MFSKIYFDIDILLLFNEYFSRLVVSAGVVHLISIALISWGSGREKDDRLEPIPALEEKTAAAIMLY